MQVDIPSHSADAQMYACKCKIHAGKNKKKYSDTERGVSLSIQVGSSYSMGHLLSLGWSVRMTEWCGDLISTGSPAE